MSITVVEQVQSITVNETTNTIEVKLIGTQGPAGASDHLLLSNIGTNTHAQIDTHIADTNNPHQVDAGQVGTLFPAENYSQTGDTVQSHLTGIDNQFGDLNTDISTLVANNTGVNTGDQDLSPYELLSNKATNLSAPDNTKYPTTLAVSNAIAAIPAGGVTSFNTRTGAVTSQSGDYTKAQVGLGSVDNTSDINKPISTATQTALDLKVDENVAIVGATKTKITYDAKGLVTSGADATTADINDSLNRRYVTDADLVDLGNLSGTNTGDQNLSGLVPYIGASANVNIGTNTYIGQAGQFERLENSLADTVFDLDLRIGYDLTNVESFKLNERNLHQVTGDACFNWTNGPMCMIDPALGDSYLFFEGGTTPYIQNYVSQDALVFGNTTIIQFLQPYVKMNQVLDSSGFVSIDPNLHWLLDAGGIYPSIDYGNYQLLNIGISNSVPLLSWGLADGGSVKIYDGYNNIVVGDFTNKQLNNSSGLTTLDWGLRSLYDNTNSLSVDWDYHLLGDLNGTSIDWQNGYLHSGAFGGVISHDYKNHLLNNGGGFLSINYTSHKMYDSGGSVISIDYSLRDLADSTGLSTLNWNSRETLDSTSVRSISWGSRGLYSSGNALMLDWSSTGTFVVNAPVATFKLGTAAAPSITFAGDTNTGIYSPSADNLAITTGGAIRFNVFSGAVESVGQVRAGAGTVSLPSFCPSNDTNSGMYGIAADTLGFTTGGVERMRLGSTGNLGIGGTANANAILDLQSTTKAFMPPRMTTTEKNAVASPTAGMVVYDSTLNKLCVRTAAAWETITSV